MANDMIPFGDKVRTILKSRKITTAQFEVDTGIGRRVLYRNDHRHHKSTLMAIAYYLNMTVEDLVDGTDAIDILYG